MVARSQRLDFEAVLEEQNLTLQFRQPGRHRLPMRTQIVAGSVAVDIREGRVTVGWNDVQIHPRACGGHEVEFVVIGAHGAVILVAGIQQQSRR